MTTPEENKKAEAKILIKDRFVSIIEVTKIIDECYEKYLDDKLSTSDSMIACMKHKIRVLYSLNKKSFVKKE